MIRHFIAMLMMYTALAVILGHNIVGHHHHLEHDIMSHYHHNSHFHFNGHHHHHSDSEDENEDWVHFFSSFQHSEEGLIFLNNHFVKNTLKLHLPECSMPFALSTCVNQLPYDVRQNSPPHEVKFNNSQISLPSGLRAPPLTVV